MSETLYVSIDVETCGGFSGRLIWDVGLILHTFHGDIVDRAAFLVRDALPFLPADGFWGSRKNDLLVLCLEKRRIIDAPEAWDILQSFFDRASILVAYNSSFEVSALAQTEKLLRLPALTLPDGEVDLALYVFDSLNMESYARYALDAGFLTHPKRNISSKAEHILAWLGFDSANHCHLAIEDVETQLDLWRACIATGASAKLGQRITYIAHPIWRRFFWRSRGVAC